MKLLFPGKFATACAFTALLFCPIPPCVASPMTSATKILAPALASIHWDATFLNRNVAVDADPGSGIFPAGDLLLGSVPASDRIIPFRHDDMARLTSTALLTDIFQQPDHLASNDTLSIFAGLSERFGDEVFVLDPASSRGQGARENADSLTRTGSEGSGAGERLLLVGAGLLGVFMLLSLTSRSKDQGKIPPAPVRKPIAGRAWVQRGTTFNMPNPDQRRPVTTTSSLSGSNTLKPNLMVDSPFLAHPSSSV